MGLGTGMFRRALKSCEQLRPAPKSSEELQSMEAAAAIGSGRAGQAAARRLTPT